MSDPKPIALITGGEGDLAKALASRLRSDLYDVRTPGRDELDVTSPESVEAYFEKLDQLDFLINNAGITCDALFVKQSPTDWQRVIDVSLKGAHLCSQRAAALMLRRRSGHIINIGSFSALRPPVGQTAYAAAKAGLVALTKSYAAELGKRNIRVNCVLPGFLETRMTAGLSEKARTAALEKHVLGKFTTVEEAAEQIAYLANCGNISGQMFQLDSRA